METNKFSYSIHHLKLIPQLSNHITENFIFTSLTPFKTDKFTSIKPKTFSHTNKKIKIKYAPSFTYKEFVNPNNRYNNIYNTIFIKTDFNKKKKASNIFPKISLSIEQIKGRKINKSENKNPLIDSKFKMLNNSRNKYNLKKENLFFMKEKKSEIQNIHINLMRDNEMHILSKQNNELNSHLKNENNNKEDNNKFSCISLTEENKAFENEYNNIGKNKLKAKDLILKEINNIGKQMSWIKEFQKDGQKKMEGKGENNKNEINEDKNDLMNSIFIKRIKGKDPVLEINQTSNFPIIAHDKKLISKLWKNDMIKYCKYLLDVNTPKDKKFISNLLEVYD